VRRVNLISRAVAHQSKLQPHTKDENKTSQQVSPKQG